MLATNSGADAGWVLRKVEEDKAAYTGLTRLRIANIKINFFSNPKMAIESPLSTSHNPSILYGKPIYFSFIKGGKKVSIIKKGISVHAFSAKHT